MICDGLIHRNALQPTWYRRVRLPHFERGALDQNGGVTFQQDINRGEIGRRFLLPDCDTINQVPNPIGTALKHYALIRQEQQIFARRHIPKDARQHPNERATIGNVPNAKHALKWRNAGGDGQ
jgi:hypothetical protein